MKASTKYALTLAMALGFMGFAKDITDPAPHPQMSAIPAKPERAKAKIMPAYDRNGTPILIAAPTAPDYFSPCFVNFDQNNRGPVPKHPAVQNGGVIHTLTVWGENIAKIVEDLIP